MTKRIEYIRSSGIRKIFEKASKLKDIVNFSIGQPDFPVPQNIKDGIIKAINDNKTGYTPTTGIPELRNKILNKYKGIKCGEDVIITPGVTQAIFLAYSSIIEEGDELIVIDPYFVVYPDLCTFLNGKTRLVKTRKDFGLDLDKISETINDKTKAIIINSPNNPTGHVISKEDLVKLSDIAKENDLWIISDEVYSDFVYDGEFHSPSEFYEKTIVLNGFSKNMALTGLRLGYAVGPNEIINKMAKLQMYTTVCAPSAVQWAVAENFECDISGHVKEFKNRRDLVYNLLKEDFNVVKPNGAFYLYVGLPERISGEKFCDECLENGVLVVPGNAFSRKDNHFRISYATCDANLVKGCKILRDALQKVRS